MNKIYNNIGFISFVAGIVLGLVSVVVLASCTPPPAADAPTSQPVREQTQQRTIAPTSTPGNKVINIKESPRIYYGTHDGEYLRKISDNGNTCYFRNLGTANAVLSCVR